MKRVIWKDDSGIYHCSLLRDIDQEENPEVGVPINPPPIKRIVEESAMEIQNELIHMGILTYRDLMNQPNSVSSVLDRVLRRSIVQAYRLEESKDNGII